MTAYNAPEHPQQLLMSSANDLPAKLRAARAALHLSRAELARQAGVSAETIKAYELGLRRPSRELLTAVLDTLRVERAQRDEILISAGFAPGVGGPELLPSFQFALEDAHEHVSAMPWPAFVLNEYMEIACANRLIELVWGIDVERELPESVDRNLMRFASDPRFGDRMGNWDELIRVAIAVFKGHHRGPETLDEPSTYFSSVLDEFLKGDSSYIRRMMQAWSETDPIEAKIRWTYPVVWDEPDIGRMRFLSVVNPCNHSLGLAFNDWVPLDADTWGRLAALQARDAG